MYACVFSSFLSSASLLSFLALIASNRSIANRNVRQDARLHKLCRARKRAVLQELPRPQVRTEGLRFRWRRRLPLDGHWRPVSGRGVSFAMIERPFHTDTVCSMYSKKKEPQIHSSRRKRIRSKPIS